MRTSYHTQFNVSAAPLTMYNETNWHRPDWQR